jgi:glucose/arabinose dehydrogenase
MRLTLSVLSLLLCACTVGGSAEPTAADPPDAADGEVVMQRVESEEETFRVVRVVGDLDHPWAVDWLPDGRMLITERSGRLLLVDGQSKTALSGVPKVWANGQGGLLDVRVAPGFAESRWVYFSYSAAGEGGAGTVLARARLEGESLADVEELYRQFPFVEPSIHFGSRIAFLEDGTLMVTLGERGMRRAGGGGAQDSTNTIGTTVRLNMDGSVPGDNPFVGRDDVPDEVYSYGHRNQQGMAVHPETREVWQHEHGPHGGDELNRITAGTNYGWPAITYGDTYTDQSPIGGTKDPAMAQPVTYWDPSIAPSGMAFYAGDKFPGWKNQLFVGALAHSEVRRVVLDGRRVVHQEELLEGDLGRIRDVAAGPDGHLYLLTDADNGALYRLEPAE